jgi:hypothetical protein
MFGSEDVGNARIPEELEDSDRELLLARAEALRHLSPTPKKWA